KGGSIGNTGTAALIRGFDAIVLRHGINTVTNSGTISGDLYGYGGALDHANGIIAYNNSTTFIIDTQAGGLISAPNYGVYVFFGGAGTLTNTGTITGKDGVFLLNGGASTVINAGTIAGAYDAVVLSNSDDRLVIDPGAVFIGNVDGRGG